MTRPVYIRRFAAWAPGVETPEEWGEWKLGAREVLREAVVPKLPFVPMLLRRRLSDVTKMAVYVSHFASAGDSGVKTTFASEFGEVQQQLKISETLADTNNVTPAMFSLSVFNAPVSCSSIVENNMSGYSASYSGEKSFEYGLKDCENAIGSGEEDNRLFVFADELIPEIYASITTGYPNLPFAFALLLSATPEEGDIPLVTPGMPQTHFAAEQAAWFLKNRVLQ